MNIFRLTICTMFIVINFTEARNPRRPHNKITPSINVCASNQTVADSWISEKCKKQCIDKKNYTLTNQFLRAKPLKEGFNDVYFKQHLLPSNETIHYKNKKGSINSTVLQALAESVLNEVQQGKKTFTHFTILKCKDFNFNNLSGLLVLKFKDYPFVLKLSIEHPHTIVKPYSKSFEANCIFMIGGNFRHLSNFTRIPNLENLRKILSFNPFYLDKIDFPRKWYWQPKNNYNLVITWKETPYRSEETIIIPSIYATLSDLVEIDTSQSQRKLNKMALRISHDTGFLVDPHAGNLVIDKNSKKHTLLDTENFRLIIGSDRIFSAKTYIGWFAEMIISSSKKYAGRTKRERIEQSFYT